MFTATFHFQEPHAPVAIQYGVFASKWPSADGRATLYTVVNRAGTNLTGPQIVLDLGDVFSPAVRHFPAQFPPF